MRIKKQIYNVFVYKLLYPIKVRFIFPYNVAFWCIGKNTHTITQKYHNASLYDGTIEIAFDKVTVILKLNSLGVCISGYGTTENDKNFIVR